MEEDTKRQSSIEESKASASVNAAVEQTSADDTTGQSLIDDATGQISISDSSISRGDFSTGSIPGAIMRLAAPMTMAQLINILYSVVDRIYLGHMKGVEHYALTGVGLTMPVIAIVTSVAALCGSGGGPLFSIARGKGDDEEAGQIMGNAFSLLLLLGAVMTFAVIAFRRPILYLFGASDDTYPFAGDYLSVYSLSTIFMMITYGMNPLINAQGFGKIGMLTVAIGAIINITLDPIFIFVLNMGVRGAALATAIAQLSSAIWVLQFLTGKRTVLKLQLRNMKLRAARVRRLLTLGLAGFFMSLSTSLTQIVCNVMLQRYGGDLYVGIMTVISSLREVIQMPITGMQNGCTPVIGYNYGAGEFGRVRKSVKFTVAVMVSYATLIWAALMIFPHVFIGIFSDDAKLIEAGVPALRTYFVFYVFLSMQISSQSVFLGLGRSKNAIFFSLLRKAIIAAPLTVLLPIAGLGINGVFIAEAISQLVGGLICICSMYLIVYKRLLAKNDTL